MIPVELGGRVWRFEVPRPAFALRLYELGRMGEGRVGGALIDILLDYMWLNDWVEFDFGRAEGLPDGAVLEVFYRWLETACGKPFSAVAALCNAMVESWSMVRGRLVTSGLADPLWDVPTLAGMLDAVEFMVMEGHKDDKERDRYRRQVYRPRARVGEISKPGGFEDSDMQEQAKMLDAIGGGD